MVYERPLTLSCTDLEAIAFCLGSGNELMTTLIGRIEYSARTSFDRDTLTVARMARAKYQEAQAEFCKHHPDRR